MTYYDPQGRGVVRITCDGKPLDGPYLPPESALKELGRFLASRYSAKDAPIPESGKETTNNA